MPRLLWTIKQHVGPQPRILHAMAYDSQRRRAVLFGGDSLQASTFGDTWEWDGDNWTQMNDIGPSARAGHALAYDSVRHRVVLFGGSGVSGALDDTWEWDGEDWTQMADRGPGARTGHGMVFDTAQNRVLLFGGEIAGEVRNDTWEWDGEEWVQVEDTGPAARRGHAMAFDEVRQRAVLFGGTTASQTFGDTWEWDGTAWAQVSTFGPPATLGASLIWTGRRSLLFGGASALTGSPTLSSNSWEWDGAHWTIRQDMGPGPRMDHAMVFDRTRSRGVLFGGTASAPVGPTPQTALNDTWEQFERGAAVVVPPPDGVVTLESVTVTPEQPSEGQGFTIRFNLSAPSLQPFSIHFIIRDGTGASLGESDAPGSGGANSAELEVPGAFPPGTYTVEASFEEVTRTATFEVQAQTSVTLQSLTCNPPSVTGGQDFTLSATISGPPPGSNFSVPVMIGFADGSSSLTAIPVPDGTTSGAVTLNFGAVTGTVNFTGSLGGVVQTATLQIT